MRIARLSRGRRRALPVLLVAVAGVLLSGSAFRMLTRNLDASFHQELERQALASTGGVVQAMKQDFGALEALRGLFEASETITRKEFEDFARRITSKNATIYSLVWFAWEHAADGSELLNARFGEPLADGRHRLGLDLASRGFVKAALERTRTTGEVAVTKSFQLDSYGDCLMALAVLEEGSGSGVLAAIIPLSRLVEGALDHTAPLELDLYLYEENEAEESRLACFHSSRSKQGTVTPLPLDLLQREPHIETNIELGGIRWRQLLRSASGPPGSQSLAAWLTLVLGLSLTAVLCAYLRMLLSQRDRVRTQIRRRTTELEQATRRLRTETQRRERAEFRFLDAVDKISQGIALFDPLDQLTFFNSHYVEMYSAGGKGPYLGMTLEEVLRIQLEHGMIEEALGREEEWLEERMEKHRIPREDVEVQASNGSWRRVAEHRLPDGSTYMVITDITQEKKREEQLRQTQRMEAVGQLTGGIAHDFNNLLTVIMGNLDMLETDLANTPEQASLARDAGRAAERGAELTQRLLAFSRRQSLMPSVTDVNQLISDTLPLLERALGEPIKVRRDLDPTLGKTIVDPAQLETALLNLAFNSRDAMPEGGELTIRTERARLEPSPAAHLEEIEPGDYLLISVVDTGTGMSSEDRKQAFEPFFTTKEVGKGSGLGLSMVYGFIKQSGGHVRLSTEEGHGTTVLLYLPETKEGEEVESSA
ncbi:MAG: ATP-binding protein [Planctomycetota bacterium]